MFKQKKKDTISKAKSMENQNNLQRCITRSFNLRVSAGEGRKKLLV